MNGFDYLLTYNGKHFDLPFITKKRAPARSCRESCARTIWICICLNGHSEIRNILFKSETKIRRGLHGFGPARGDEIDGKESITLYRTYEGSFDEREKTNCVERFLLRQSRRYPAISVYKIFSDYPADRYPKNVILGFPIAGQNGPYD